MNDATTFFTLLDAAGQLPTKINKALAAGDVDAANAANNGMGAMLAALESWGKAFFAAPTKPQLPPGMVVADVGEAAYTGSISPASLSVEDWRVFSQNYERLNYHAIFSSTPVGQEKDTDGRSLHQGDLAQRVDLDAYKANGGLLAPYL